MNNYLVTGTFRKIGTSNSENFQIEKDAASSRSAYMQVQNALYDDGCATINVVAIKMKCAHCGDLHVTVDPNLWVD